MKNKLFEGLKSTLGEATVKELTTTFNEALEDGIKLKTAEKIKQLEEKSEEFVQKKVSSLMEAKERELIAEYETKHKEFGDYIIGNLDTFLESAVVDTISESVIEDVARVQMFAPIISDVMESFGKHYSPIAPKDADTALADALKESAELKKMLDKTLKENKKMVEMSERAAVRVMFTEKTQGLVKSAKEKIWEMVKDFDFETVERKIDGLVSLVEEFSNDGEDNSVGGVGGTSDDIDLSGMEGGEDDEGDGTEDEPTFPMTLPKSEFDAMVAIEVMDEEEDVPVAKKVADMISAYVKEPEEGEEVDEEIVNFEIPESVGRELKGMFTNEEGEVDEEAFGEIGEEVKTAIVDFVGTIPDEEDDGMGDEGDEGDDMGDGMDEPVVSPVTEWHKKWAVK